MKRKGFKRTLIKRNRRGYWEKGGECEKEIIIATVILGVIVIVLGVDILTKLFWG